KARRNCMSENLSAQTVLSGPAEALFAVPLTSVRKIDADGVQVFYREAGDPHAAVGLLLHGVPASSFMFRELIPRLADHYRVIAPDLPGFGFTEVSEQRKYTYSFDALALTIAAFTAHSKLDAMRSMCSIMARQQASVWRWLTPSES